MSVRVYDVRHDYDADHVVHIETDDTGNLALIVIDGDATATLKVNREGAKQLRLAIMRYERKL